MSININEFYTTEEQVEKALQPTDEAAREYMNPLLDDTWVRQTDLIDMKKLKVNESMHQFDSSNNAKEFAAKDVQDSGNKKRETTTLEELERQEAFMRSYKESKLREDANAATSYKSRMIENFRKKREQQYSHEEEWSTSE